MDVNKFLSEVALIDKAIENHVQEDFPRTRFSFELIACAPKEISGM